MKSPFPLLALAVVGFLLSACMDQDPFGLLSRTVIAPYELERFEGDTYYLHKHGQRLNGGGCLEGTVEEIGWTNGVIAARRTALFRGDPDGWMIIDASRETITGPISDSQFRKDYTNLHTMPAPEAWKKL